MNNIRLAANLFRKTCTDLDEKICRQALAKYRDKLTHGANLEVLHGKERVLSLRINQKIRIILLPDDDYPGDFRATYLATDHNYDKAIRRALGNKDVETVELTEDGEGNLAANEELETVIDAYYTLYDHSLIKLTTEQQTAIHSPLPAVIAGSPGSGKSCIAHETLKEYIHVWRESGREPQKLAYVANSPGLAMYMKSLLANEHLLSSEEQVLLDIQFVTPADLYRQKHAQANLIVDGKQHCISWLLGHKEHNKLFSNEDVEKIYQEFRIISGYAHEQQEEKYITQRVGNQETLYPGNDSLTKEKKAWLYAAYCKYKERLKNDNEVNVQFEPLECDRKFNKVVYDEFQDASTVQALTALDIVEDDQIVLLVGYHQGLYDSTNITHYLGQIFHEKKGKKLDLIHLPASYRCPNKVIKFANAILKAKRHVSHGISVKNEMLAIETRDGQEANEGVIRWIKEASDLPAIQADNINVAIIYDIEHTQEIIDKFGILDKDGHRVLPPFAFTIEQSKGLQFETVILWRLLSGRKEAVFKKASLKLPANYSSKSEDRTARAGVGEEYNVAYTTAMNDLFVGATRTTKNLLCFDPKPAKGKVKEGELRLNRYLESVVQEINTGPTNEDNLNLDAVVKGLPTTETQLVDWITSLLVTNDEENHQKAIAMIRSQLTKNDKKYILIDLIERFDLYKHFPEVERKGEKKDQVKSKVDTVATSSRPVVSKKSASKKLNATSSSSKVEKRKDINLDSDLHKLSCKLLIPIVLASDLGDKLFDILCHKNSINALHVKKPNGTAMQRLINDPRWGSVLQRLTSKIANDICQNKLEKDKRKNLIDNLCFIEELPREENEKPMFLKYFIDNIPAFCHVLNGLNEDEKPVVMTALLHIVRLSDYVDNIILEIVRQMMNVPSAGQGEFFNLLENIVKLFKDAVHEEKLIELFLSKDILLLLARSDIGIDVWRLFLGSNFNVLPYDQLCNLLLKPHQSGDVFGQTSVLYALLASTSGIHLVNSILRSNPALEEHPDFRFQVLMGAYRSEKSPEEKTAYHQLLKCMPDILLLSEINKIDSLPERLLDDIDMRLLIIFIASLDSIQLSRFLSTPIVEDGIVLEEHLRSRAVYDEVCIDEYMDTVAALCHLIKPLLKLSLEETTKRFALDFFEKQASGIESAMKRFSQAKIHQLYDDILYIIAPPVGNFLENYQSLLFSACKASLEDDPKDTTKNNSLFSLLIRTVMTSIILTSGERNVALDCVYQNLYRRNRGQESAFDYLVQTHKGQALICQMLPLCYELGDEHKMLESLKKVKDKSTNRAILGDFRKKISSIAKINITALLQMIDSVRDPSVGTSSHSATLFGGQVATSSVDIADKAALSK